MKKINYYMLTIVIVLMVNCTNDFNPQPVNEEEVISTVRMTLTPGVPGDVIVLESRDLDGIGPNDPVVTVSGNLLENTEYVGQMTILNETVNPEENITEEIIEEANEHQFFFTSTNGLIFEYTDEDDFGFPIGVSFKLMTGSLGNGIITVVLRHEPQKDANGVNEGQIENAGGETDLQVSFEVEVG